MLIGRDPSKVGVLWGCGLIVAETEQEAKARREQLLTMIPKEAIGPYLAHNSGYDFSKLPARFKLTELNKQIAAEIGATEATVKVHRSQLLRKMGAHSLPDLVRMAQRLGIPHEAA